MPHQVSSASSCAQPYLFTAVVVLGSPVSGLLDVHGRPVAAYMITPWAAWALDPERWMLERGSAWLHSCKSYKRLRTRWERRAVLHLGLPQLVRLLTRHRRLIA